MTKEEILDVPVVEKEKKVKPEVSEDSVLSTFTTEENKMDDVMTSNENNNGVQVDNIISKDDELEHNVETISQNNSVINEEVEDGKTVELADNILSDNNVNNLSDNINLPVDLNPYVKMVKEKLMAFGKIALGFFEKIGNFVENLFRKK